MAKRNQHAKQGFGVETPQDAMHMGEGKRIRLEDVPLPDSTGDQQVGNRAYNDERYQAKGNAQASAARWITPPVVQWTGTGYIYSTNLCSYELPGSTSPIVANPTSKTLSSPHASLDRFDLFVWNDLGQCLIIEGTPATEPIVPVVADPLTQIAGPFVLVKGGTNEPPPGNLTNTVIYNENTEWAGAAVGCTSNFNNAVPVFTGFKSLEISAIAINDYVEFTAPANFNPKTFDSLGLQLNLKQSLLTNQNLGVRFYDISNNPVSSEANLGFDKNLVNAWQLAGVAISNFTFTSETPVARKIRFRWTRGTNDHAGFYFDLVQLQGGILNPPAIGSVVLSGQVSGSGQTGTPIPVSLTEKAISDQTEFTDPLPGGTRFLAWINGTLAKVAPSLFGDGHTHANKAALDQVSGVNTGDQDLSGKVDKVPGKSLIDDTEIARLAGINDRFKGKYTSLAALQTAVPTANPGDYAQVDTGASNPVTNYNWDAEDGWVLGSTGGAPIANTDELPEGSTNLYFTGARVLNTILAGISFATNRAITAGDSILVAMGLLQKQVTDNGTAISNNTTAINNNASAIANKQNTLVSGTNIKTVNGESLLGSGNVAVSTPEPAHRESNTVLFDADYITGVNASPRSGNILFDFTGAKRGATTLMYHQDASAFTFPATAKKNFKNSDVSTTKVNKFMFTLVKKTSGTEIVEVTLVWEGGEP